MYIKYRESIMIDVDFSISVVRFPERKKFVLKMSACIDLRPAQNIPDKNIQDFVQNLYFSSKCIKCYFDQLKINH